MLRVVPEQIADNDSSLSVVDLSNQAAFQVPAPFLVQSHGTRECAWCEIRTRLFVWARVHRVVGRTGSLI